MKETKNVPQLRFSGFDDEWEEKKLGEIVTEFKNPVELPHNGYIRLGIRSHAKGTFHEYVAPGHELEAAQMSEVKADNLIMSITFAWEHAVAITDKNDEGKLVSQRFPQFSFNKGQVPEFYKYVIADEKFRHHLWLSSPGGAGRNRVLNIKESMEYKSNIPSSDFEQQKIGTFLSHVDSLIQAKTKKLESLKAVKKSLLQKCFPKAGEKVPEMRFAGFSGDWEEKKLGEVSEKIMVGIANSATYAYADKGVVMFRNQNIKPNYLDDNDLIYLKPSFELTYKNKRLKKNDILVARTGYPGTACVVPKNYENAQTFTTLILRLNQDVLDPYYVTQYLNSPIGISYFTSTQIGGGQKNSGASILSDMPFRYPSITEQQSIGQFFSKYDFLISSHQKEIDKLKDIKKSLLQKMFV